MASAPPDLQGVRIRLRQPISDDIETRWSIGQHKDIVEGYGGTFDPDAPFSRSGAEQAIRFIRDQPCAWVIDAGRFIGHVRFHGHVPQDRRANLAIGIDDPAFLGRGYGTEAIRLALGHVFGSGLHRVSLRVLATNTRAIACYRKCGFIDEGREREAALIDGRWYDDVVMGLLAREFYAGHDNPNRLS
ncbi:RimJ/RimL family protein N-acetyltransferase [Methylorubrum rhodinum]|uniref:RimJ/RimL family protein N-acetyltransferase n=1 Tax=Methylorubrum rhodinum TaxID=29428 RepID=A0A840ZFR8_9HYPH|nr:GNAT family protein [Methylorubrum rhodinum]MBB5756028.1 RimJ/RimL family protein N-acetyltransferase [Methylorubrum rhodinum]